MLSTGKMFLSMDPLVPILRKSSRVVSSQSKRSVPVIFCFYVPVRPLLYHCQCSVPGKCFYVRTLWYQSYASRVKSSRVKSDFRSRFSFQIFVPDRHTARHIDIKCSINSIDKDFMILLDYSI